MAKHRRQGNLNTRRIASTAAVAATAAVTVPAAANAAEVVVPETDIRFEVAGLENVPNIKQLPNIDRYIPAFKADQGAGYAAAVEAPVAEAPAPAPVQSVGEKVLEAARSAVGSPYVYGANGPSAFDCSGLTSWAYRQAGVSIPRTSQAQASAGTPVSLDALQPGDIIVYYSGASHVGIYTGHGTIIDALNSGTPVGERSLNYMPIHSAVRF
ncbi:MULTISPECIES: C40 family peptidase [Corynebacterium]|uniref:NlpC/P60 family protein n=3 Tax=Corynebacterium TaxID=1716 RepID=A0A2N6TRZ5_9CORY|nr:MULTISPECIES: C40 family peptidase [Corynebacterium]KKO80375.1 endopeptidase [Corynebacterium minutissimum]MTD90932.1 NlpC/P60 family protein [Corynebacterium aurimucosum]OFK66298.1 endopeptidase [Corynebacterium sp. HMSC074A09]OFK70196.1 endopeptidase [Corynebacterium sp. HMSC076G08]OFN33179.1 endopeptidase [Corynebacterium sp. HMSC072A04]